jgi:hypothetical protein
LQNDVLQQRLAEIEKQLNSESRSLRTELDEEKARCEQLSNQLDFELHRPKSGAVTDDADDDDEASSLLSFRQSWPNADGCASDKNKENKSEKESVTSGLAGRVGRTASSGGPGTRQGECALPKQKAPQEPRHSPQGSPSSGDASRKRKEADVVRISALPRAPQFRSWKLSVRDEVASASGDPDAGFKWILQVELPDSTFDTLGDSADFGSLDAKLAAGLAKVAQGDLGRSISTAKERLALQGIFMKGRQALKNDLRSLHNFRGGRFLA